MSQEDPYYPFYKNAPSSSTYPSVFDKCPYQQGSYILIYNKLLSQSFSDMHGLWLDQAPIKDSFETVGLEYDCD